jgi:hypothetical protein
MSKIKSIKLKTNFWFYKKGKVFTFAEFQEALDSYCSNAPEPMQVDQESTESYLLESPEDFEIEHEKPQILKRPDGSVISGLEDGQDIIKVCLLNNFIVAASRTYDQNLDLHSLQSGLIYLPEDKHLAEKKAKQIPKQSEIKLEIDRLNAEEGWVADLSNGSQTKVYLICKKNQIEKAYEHYESFVGIKYMSETTAKTILAKYSQDEIKQYLDIII